MQSVSIFGLGYVGSVTAACLAHHGCQVIGVDINPAKVEMLNSGRSPIVEARVEELASESVRAGRLRATTDVRVAVHESDVSFISVATPSLRNGKLDLTSITRVCSEIGQVLRGKSRFHIVVVRSTVLPGTTDSVVIPALEAASGKHAGSSFAVCVNPEFLREGTAVKDFFEPPITVIGASAPHHFEFFRQLYGWVPGRMFETPITVAEMVKYACNAFHAVKVGFANEIGTLCKQLDVDTQEVMEIFCADSKLNISTAYLSPGFAFGGSCLPKELRALSYRAKELDLRLPLLESVLPSNQEHIERAVQAVLHSGKRKVGMLGLSFKAGTDDLRESPLVQLIKHLLGEGCQIRIWDDQVSLGRLVGSNRQFIEEVIPHIGSLLTDDLQQVIVGAEVVVIGTRAADKETLRQWLQPEQLVIDLVNLEKQRRLATPAYAGICW